MPKFSWGRAAATPSAPPLRPQTLTDVIGQQQLISGLQVFIESAQIRQKPLDHVLFVGPPGLGKTTLAESIANDLKLTFIQGTGTSIDRDELNKVIGYSIPMVLFIDEIHSLERTLVPTFYPLMEDFRMYDHHVVPFTLIGATTDPGRLPQPLRDRFAIQYHLDYYPVEEIVKVIQRASLALRTAVDVLAAEEIANRARGTPRVAINLLKRCEDFRIVRRALTVTQAIVEETSEHLSIDSVGLTKLDRDVLEIIFYRYKGGPAGLRAIAAAVGEDARNIETVVEPWLIREGYLERTQRGRMLSLMGTEFVVKLTAARINGGKDSDGNRGTV